MVSLSFLSSARNVLFQRVLPQPFQFHGQQIRHNWQIHLAKGRNKFTGKMAVKGDPAVWFAGANLKANPSSDILKYYEKPTKKKKRLKLTKIWRRREQAVTDLIKYIKLKRHLERPRMDDDDDED